MELEPERINQDPYGEGWLVIVEATYELTEEIRPERTQLVPLSLLVMGDEEARGAISGSQAITVDGCKLACATKMVQESGGFVAHEFAVLDDYSRHRELKPRGIAQLSETGEQLVSALAEEIAEAADNLHLGEGDR